MKRRLVLFAAFLILTTTASAQIGKSVSVAAGTPEDKDLAAIYAAPDGPDKIALLDKFMAEHGTGDLALLGYQLYAQTYLAQKNYAKVYEYGEKAMSLDPDDFSALILMMHAADEQGDAQKMYALGEKVEPLLARWGRGCLPVVEARLAAGERAVHPVFDLVRTTWLEEPALRAIDPTLRSLANVNTPEDLRRIEGETEP